MNGDGILALLAAAHIPHDVVRHDAILNVEEGNRLGLPHPEAIAMSLLLCDDRREHFWLAVIPKDARLDLKALRARLGSRRLTFASADETQRLLGLDFGSVSPFGALNDTAHQIPVLIDAAFEDATIAVPLNTNTATVWLPAHDLAALLRTRGSQVEFLPLRPAPCRGAFPEEGGSPRVFDWERNGAGAA
ncbi:MAG: YbaK/EbsC family protein [Bifidobacterium sp.]|nr:YbaK/EbsC family protein [Bifidobacterium sp.]